jgi:hypothetical protein
VLYRMNRQPSLSLMCSFLKELANVFLLTLFEF